ncbi:MAG TPA: hypothetical protein DCL48_06525, partial [Alphaproteobacteria bacterium]|nr:hypothetical protein [Alphaproteobacteria bacterium]
MYNPDRDQFHINEPEPKHVRRARIRLMIAAGMFALIFAVLAGRLVQLTLAPRDAASQSGKAGAAQTAWRRDITDRHGQILATDLKTSSLFADARYVWDAQEITAKVLQIFPDLDASQVHARLASRQAFVWIKRQITPAQREAVYRLGFPALGFRDEPRRVYPLGALAAHVLGYVGVDNQGQAGLERGLNDRLLDPQRTTECLAL